MKKLIILATFLGLGYVGVNAQNVAPSKAPTTPQTTKMVESSNATVTAPINEDAVVDATAKTDKKGKQCSTEEKKNCAPANGNKSCCSSKKQAAKPNQ